MKRRQSELFPEASPAPSAKDLRIVRQGSQPLSKEQQAFNRLLARVQTLRRELEKWTAFEERHRQTVLRKLVPLQNELNATRRDMILACDAILDGRLGGGVSGKTERKHLWLPLQRVFQQTRIGMLQAHEPFVDSDAGAAFMTAFRAGIRNRINEKVGEDLVHEVLIEQVDFLSKEEIRDNTIRRRLQAGTTASEMSKNFKEPAAASPPAAH